MIKFKKNTVPDDLDSWGKITDLGATLLEGDVQASGKFVVGSPQTNISCAFFACTRGKFRMVYEYTEHAVVLEGSVNLTDEKTGKTTRYEAGDSWYVEKGTPVLWEVTTPRFVKNYIGVA
ncbi:cupin domain-containing protein [uncultured Bartonella sp.]|uniref:cupin domain-containing protein n=1 Tax=uncultured Bartonella sp. TaxID=104108 RepID=UPI0025E6C353|nr:cupin domain-containing protein [uncultured Bartonella sp.]